MLCSMCPWSSVNESNKPRTFCLCHTLGCNYTRLHMHINMLKLGCTTSKKNPVKHSWWDIIFWCLTVPCVLGFPAGEWVWPTSDAVRSHRYSVGHLPLQKHLNSGLHYDTMDFLLICIPLFVLILVRKKTLAVLFKVDQKSSPPPPVCR